MAESLYIHIPFCTHICAYCDFKRVGYNRLLASSYLESLEREMKESCSGSFFKTVYLGGGTPSALDEDLFEKLLQIVAPYTKNNIEYTIEANPESLDESKIALLKKYGINRVSLGVQSTDEKLLALMHRYHNNDQVKIVIETLHQYGIDHISIDLIYSLPFQTLSIWKETLNTVVNLPIDHISLYSLTIEENSEFKRLGYDHLDDELEADMYEYACQYLCENGYEHYEISNFCKKNSYSRHNMAYWHYDDFVGVGIGASGKEHHERYDNIANFKEYSEGKYIKNRIPLSIEDEMFEEVMMSLRTNQGIDKERFKARYGRKVEDVYCEAITKNVASSALYEENNHIIATAKARGYLNTILMDFMED